MAGRRSSWIVVLHLVFQRSVPQSRRSSNGALQDEGDDAAGAQEIDLQRGLNRRNSLENLGCTRGAADRHRYRHARGQTLLGRFDFDPVTWRQSQFFRVKAPGKAQGEDAHADQVRAMDPLEADGQHGCRNIPRLVPGWTQPIVIGRHAFGDVYRAANFKVPGAGELTVKWTPAGGGPAIEHKVYDFPGPGVALGMYNLDESIRGFARACLNYGLEKGRPVYLSTKNTVLSTYDGRFKDLFEEIFQAEFK